MSAKKTRQKKFLLIFLIPLLAIICIGTSFLGYQIFKIPQEINTLFGPPSPDLSFSQRIFLSYKLYQSRDELLTPAFFKHPELNLTIQPGESPTSVAVKLQDANLIDNSDAFVSYLVYSGLDTQIQSGSFVILAPQSAVEIANELLNPSPSQIPVSILAGWRAEEIARSLESLGVSFTQDEFLSAVDAQDAEGFLFPGTYQVHRNTTAKQLVNILTNQFSKDVSGSLKNGFKQQGLSLAHAVILASIVEREAVIDEEMPVIASVFLNRYKLGMKLDADPTVQYSLGFNSDQDTWWTNPLSAADLSFDSPYNTYLYADLPPGPIANPGLNALKAVAYPANTPYIYFRADCNGTGRHLFAETYQQHLDNACK